MINNIYFTLFILIFFNCNNSKKGVIISEQTIFDENIKTIGIIDDEVNDIVKILQKKGFAFDSSFYEFSTKEKLKYIKKEFVKYKINTERYVTFNRNIDTVKFGNLFSGGILLAGYNKNLKYKFYLQYNNKIREVPFNYIYNDFSFEIKPNKIGFNEYSGFIIQGDDTFKFYNNFIVTK